MDGGKIGSEWKCTKYGQKETATEEKEEEKEADGGKEKDVEECAPTELDSCSEEGKEVEKEKENPAQIIIHVDPNPDTMLECSSASEEELIRMEWRKEREENAKAAKEKEEERRKEALLLRYSLKNHGQFADIPGDPFHEAWLERQKRGREMEDPEGMKRNRITPKITVRKVHDYFRGMPT